MEGREDRLLFRAEARRRVRELDTENLAAKAESV
jgi:hypothetical protein